MRFNTSRYSICFIPSATKLWNDLPSMTVEVVELQKFELGANTILLAVDGPKSPLCPTVFRYFCILLTFDLVLLIFLFFFWGGGVICFRCCFPIRSIIFFFLTLLSSLLRSLVFLASSSPSWDLQSRV